MTRDVCNCEACVNVILVCDGVNVILVHDGGSESNGGTA